MKRMLGLALAGLMIALVAPAGPASADAIRTDQWYLAPLGVTKAWQTTRGAGVKVCVVDSGVDEQVPDLTGSVLARKQFTNYVNADGLVTSHGTGVASVLAGHGHGPDGSEGVVGVAPAATLLVAVVGESDPNAVQQEADAVRWCTTEGAQVINMSFGVLTAGPLAAAVAYAQDKDVVIVAASTNTFENLRTTSLPDPAGLPGVLAVTGIDRNLTHDPGAFVSSTGKLVSLAAPFSTTPGTNGYPQIGLPVADDRQAAAAGMPYLDHACGTSYSAPIVAGAAALIRAAHPSMSADDVIAALLATATPAGGSARPNRTFGWGIVDVAAAVSARLAPARGNPLITGTLQPVAAAGATVTDPPSASPTPRGPSSGWNGAAVVTTIVAGALLAGVLLTVLIRRRRGLFE